MTNPADSVVSGALAAAGICSAHREHDCPGFRAGIWYAARREGLRQLKQARAACILHGIDPSHIAMIELGNMIERLQP